MSRKGSGTAEVEAFLAELKHPQAAAVRALRAAILRVDPRITEHLKWNAPSFAITDDFATFHLRPRTGFQVVLHLGAKPRPDARVRDVVQDPEGLLEWRSADRATVTFREEADVDAKAEAFAAVLKQWITCL